MLTKWYYEILRGSLSGSEIVVKDSNGGTQTATAYYANYQATTNFQTCNQLFKCMENIASGLNGYVLFGTNSSDVSETDYKITTVSNVTISKTTVQDGLTKTATYTIVNNNTTEITITEVGIYGSFKYNSNTVTYVLMERTLLDEPVTIPASGVGQVVYTLTVS